MTVSCSANHGRPPPLGPKGIPIHKPESSLRKSQVYSLGCLLMDTMATTSAQHEAETETAPFMCRKCERVFAFRSEYDRHMKNVYPCVRPGASRYSCDACMAGFDIKTRYDQHLRTKKHLRKVQANEMGECSAGRRCRGFADATRDNPCRGHEIGDPPVTGRHAVGPRSRHAGLRRHRGRRVRLIMNMCTTVTIHVGPLSGSDPTITSLSTPWAQL